MAKQRVNNTGDSDYASMKVLKPKAGQKFQTSREEIQTSNIYRSILREMLFEVKAVKGGKRLLPSGDSSDFEIYTCLQGQMERNVLF